MSKTIESLKIFPTKNDMLQERIAETYFYQKPRSKKLSKKHSRSISAPLVALSVSLAVAVVMLALPVAEHAYNGYVKRKLSLCKTVPVFGSSGLNREAVKNFEFRGQARSNSRVTGDTIVLDNPKKYDWADMSAVMRFPMDFRGKAIVFSAKGRVGGEKISVILKDAGNRSSSLNDIFLTSSWKPESLDMDSVKGDIDLSRITHLRLESGYLGDPPKETGRASANITIYIKDINITKKEVAT